MVKGLSRKVIIVKSPDPKIFEEAIFIVRDDYLMTHGISQKELLRQAKQAAKGYSSQHRSTHLAHPLLYALVGAIMASLVWFMAMYLF